MRKIFIILCCLIGLYECPINAATDQRLAAFDASIDIILCERDNIESLFEYVDENTLVIFDIDEVVFRSKQMLGSDKWAYHEGDKFIAECGGDVKKGLLAFNPRWVKVQKAVDVELVEPNFSEVLFRLKSMRCPTMGFTARGIDLVERTKVQLDSVHVDLTDNCYYDGEEEGEGFVFKYGTLFVEIGQDKGVLLRSFFDRICKKPGKIIFLDDRKKNITYLENMCCEDKIPFVGIRYSGFDPIASNFNAKLSDVQLDYFLEHGVVLSDDEAALRMDFLGRQS